MFICGMPVHLWNIWVKFLYEGHDVKIKVTGAKMVYVYPDRGWRCLRLKGNLVLFIYLLTYCVYDGHEPVIKSEGTVLIETPAV